MKRGVQCLICHHQHFCILALYRTLQIMLLLCDVLENRRPVDNTLGAAEAAGEVHQWQEFLAELNESEAGSSLLLCLSVCLSV